MKNINNLSLKGINISNSLDLFESEESLNKALNNFLTTIDDRMKKLKLARSKGDMKEYYINIHLVNNSALRLGLKKPVHHFHSLDPHAIHKVWRPCLRAFRALTNIRLSLPSSEKFE